MRTWKQLLNSREVTPIVAIHPAKHQCRSSRILHEELRVAERSRTDRRQLKIVVPTAQFILECFQRPEGRRSGFGTYIAQQFDSIAKPLRMYPKSVYFGGDKICTRA